MSEVSEKQLKANKSNAQKGGVRTDEGKEVSKLNALKHGLLSKEVFLKGENEQTLIELVKQLRKELKPVGEVELLLVDRIIANTWRLKRALRVEVEMIKDDCKGSNFGNLDDLAKKSLGQAFSHDFANYDTYGKLIRYENSIEKGVYKALHELQRIQSSRMGNTPPAPVVVDVNVSKDEQ